MCETHTNLCTEALSPTRWLGLSFCPFARNINNSRLHNPSYNHLTILPHPYLDLPYPPIACACAHAHTQAPTHTCTQAQAHTGRAATSAGRHECGRVWARTHGHMHTCEGCRTGVSPPGPSCAASHSCARVGVHSYAISGGLVGLPLVIRWRSDGVWVPCAFGVAVR